MNCEELRENVADFDQYLVREFDEIHLYKAMEEMDNIKCWYDDMNKEQRLARLRIVNEHIQKLLTPALPSNYETMTYAELIERYETFDAREEELHKLWPPRSSRFSFSLKKPLISLCNRVRTTAVECYQGIRNKLVKSAKEIVKH